MRKYSVLICVVISVLFLVTATLLYPGGSFLDKNSVGFDWTKNFFSNLFLAKALNGAENPARIWAVIGMVFNSIGYGLFFIHTSRKIPQKHSALVLKSIGLVNMIFTFLIATPLHDIMVTVSSTLTMLGLFYITVSILKSKLHWLKFICIVCMLIFYFTMYLYGAGDWGLLAVMQKVTFLCFMLLTLTIEYFTSGEDFQQNKPKRDAETGIRIKPNLPCIFFIFLFTSASTSFAQGITNPDSLSKNSWGWNQEEREYGFAHFDQVFNAHDVARGNKVHKLPKGNAIAAFSTGGQKEMALETFLKEQKVAGILILHNGKIRLERYALGFNEASRWTSQSVAKSVTSTLVGAAIKDGYIKSVDDFLTDYLPDLKGSAYEKVTIRHLLTMTTGVRWNENYCDANADIVKFYTQKIEPGIDETVSYMRQLPREAEPGKKWVYKTGETHLLGVLVSTATGQTLSAYLSKKIWIPYGMEGKATWNFGRTNQEFAGCCLQMKLRDFGRFGQFILDGATIKNKAIVPDDWLKAATHTQVPLWPGWGYGYQWWTLSDGTFRALGIHGQMIHIDPARHLVIVVNSAWPEAENTKRQMAADSFVKSISSEIDKEK